MSEYKGKQILEIWRIFSLFLQQIQKPKLIPMKKQILMYALLMLCLSVSASSGKQLFNNGWRFHLGDIAEAKTKYLMTECGGN